MTRAEIKTKVKEKLDEVSQFDSYQIDSVDFIDKFLDAAAEKILMAVPLHLISPTDFSSQPQDAKSDGSGIVQLPADFLRITSFKMAEWDRPVTNPISKQHPVYNLQKNRITRGKPSKPICVIDYYQIDAESGDAYGFVTPGFYSGAYGWENAPTQEQITAIIGDPADYKPVDNFMIHDTVNTNTWWVYSNGSIWFINSSTFNPAL